jgi:hypothetical protein
MTEDKWVPFQPILIRRLHPVMLTIAGFFRFFHERYLSESERKAERNPSDK